MKKSFINLVDPVELLISTVLGWIVKEILDYAKHAIKNLEVNFHLKYLVAIVSLRTINALLRALRWNEQALKFMRPFVGYPVSVLLKANEIPMFADFLIPDSFSIFRVYTFELII